MNPNGADIDAWNRWVSVRRRNDDPRYITSYIPSLRVTKTDNNVTLTADDGSEFFVTIGDDTHSVLQHGHLRRRFSVREGCVFKTDDETIEQLNDAQDYPVTDQHGHVLHCSFRSAVTVDKPMTVDFLWGGFDTFGALFNEFVFRLKYMYRNSSCYMDGRWLTSISVGVLVIHITDSYRFIGANPQVWEGVPHPGDKCSFTVTFQRPGIATREEFQVDANMSGRLVIRPRKMHGCEPTPQDVLSDLPVSMLDYNHFERVINRTQAKDGAVFNSERRMVNPEELMVNWEIEWRGHKHFMTTVQNIINAALKLVEGGYRLVWRGDALYDAVWKKLSWRDGVTGIMRMRYRDDDDEESDVDEDGVRRKRIKLNDYPPRSLEQAADPFLRQRNESIRLSNLFAHNVARLPQDVLGTVLKHLD